MAMPFDWQAEIAAPAYEKGIEYCKRNRRGRLILSKGDKSYSSSEIQQKLQKRWKTTGPWSLGYGNYSSEAECVEAFLMEM